MADQHILANLLGPSLLLLPPVVVPPDVSLPFPFDHPSDEAVLFVATWVCH